MGTGQCTGTILRERGGDWCEEIARGKPPYIGEGGGCGRADTAMVVRSLPSSVGHGGVSEREQACEGVLMVFLACATMKCVNREHARVLAGCWRHGDDVGLLPTGTRLLRLVEGVWEVSCSLVGVRESGASRAWSGRVGTRPCSSHVCDTDDMPRSCGHGLSWAFGASPWPGLFQMASMREEGGRGHGLAS